MPRPRAHIGFDGNLAAQTVWGRQELTRQGAVQYGPGMTFNSRSYLSHIGTTNFVRNPRGGNGTTDWVVNTGRDLEVSPLPAPLPPYESEKVTTCLRASVQSSLGSGGWNAGAARAIASAAGVHTASMYIWVPSSWTGGQIGMATANFTGATGSGTTPVDMSKRDQWQRIQRTVTLASGDLDGFVQGNVNGHWNADEWFAMTAVQLEPRARATPFVAGDMGEGFSWASGAHASASIRAASFANLHLPTLNGVQGRIAPNNGAIGVRFTFAEGWEEATQEWGAHRWSDILIVGGPGDNNHDVIELGMSLDSGDDHVYVMWGDWGSSGWDAWIDIGHKSTMTGRSFSVIMDWTHASIDVEVAGIGKASSSRAHPGGTAGAQHIGIANDYAGWVYSGLWYDSIVAFDFIPDDEHRLEVFDETKAWTATLLEIQFPAVTRVKEEFGKNVYTIRPRLWRTDMQRTKLEELELAKPYKGSVTFNDSLEYKRQMEFEVRNPGALRELGDFVVPELTITDWEGREETHPLGHFIVLPPSMTTNPKGQVGRIQGRDLTYMLDYGGFPNGHTIAKGTNTGKAARDIAIQFGIPPKMLDMPNSICTLIEEVRYEPGDKMLEWMNKLLSDGCMYTVWTSGEGLLTTRRMTDVSQLAPVARYSTSEDGATLIPDVREDQDIDGLYNQVTVRNIRTDKPTIYYTAKVTNESSPIHPRQLQKRMNAYMPIVRAHPVINGNDIETKQVAKDIAVAKLSEAGTKLRRVDIETIVDPRADGHQVVEIDVRNGTKQHYSGRWLRRAWTINLEGSKATMSHTLNSIVDWV